MGIFGISLASMLLIGFPFMVTLLGSIILFILTLDTSFINKYAKNRTNFDVNLWRL